MTIKSGKYKDIGSPFRALSEDERKKLQEFADDIFRQIVEVVKERVRERFSISLEEEIVYAGVFEFGEDEDCAAAGGAFL